ncbi:hypothetical protein MKX03_024038 [Papaver bracteatum]|nr:hypothetical protein MKX03_024038 [Papaver bracteatum]
MEEGTEKEVSATTGFITGQLMMFISIYYAPLHLALGRPHTITVLVLPYLLFHFFWNNHKNVFDYGSTTRNSMRNLSIQCVFLNNLIFQLFNHFILPSSTLARLVNIYMFRCNNKMLFVTSSFVGWLIGHILFMKWVGLVLFWIRKNNSIRSNKYLVSELRNSMARIFSILLFITCVYYLGRIPSPIVTKKLKEETAETEERGKSEGETDVEIETISETKGTKQEEGSIEEDPSPSLCSEENSKLEILKLKEDKDLLWFEKPLVTLIFDYKRWNRPVRYIKNDKFEDAVRDEMSHYFFFTCESDGKERISFTYPPSLSIFLEMIKGKILLSTTEKPSSEELYNNWEKFEGKYFLTEEGKLNSENRTKYLFDAVTPDRHYQRIIKESIGIKEIRKEVPQWSYKLITSLEQQDGTILEETAEDHEIRSRKANHVVIFTDTERTNSTTNTNDEVEEVFVLRYSQESDFRRDIIKGSMRAQRRKTVIWEPFQTNIHSPLFFDRIYKKNWMIKSTEFKNSSFEEEAKEKDKKRKKKGEENDRLAVAESWDTVLFGQSIRGCLPRKKNKKKKKKQSFLGLRVLKEKTKGFLKDSKEKESWTHKKDFFQKKKIKELGKVNPILLVGLIKVYENKKMSIKENQIVHESSSRIRSMSWTNYSLTEKKREDLADRTSTIKNQIEKIINDKKKTFLIPDRNINPNDTSCNDKKLEAPKVFWRIFQRISSRLIRKRHSFLNFLIEKIYMDTLLYLINIPRINAQFSLDLKKGDIDKKSYNDEIKKEEVEERKKKRIHVISTKKRALSNISNKNLHHFCAPVDLSQAYVFYKFSQTQVINKYHMRSVLQYNGTSFFLKDRIKNFFGTQGILNSESRHKKLSNFETNGWKNWLNSHYNYQYNLSKITSSQLALQKPRNGVNQSNTISNKASTKLDSYNYK